MPFFDLAPGLEALVDSSEGEARAEAWAALTHYVVVTGGRNLCDADAADRRLRQLLDRIGNGT
jgi:hypothetical protein